MNICKKFFAKSANTVSYGDYFSQMLRASMSDTRRLALRHDETFISNLDNSQRMTDVG